MLINAELTIDSSEFVVSRFIWFPCFSRFVRLAVFFGSGFLGFALLVGTSCSGFSTTFGAIGFKGPSGRGAACFLGPLGPRLAGLSTLLTILSPTIGSAPFAIDDT